METLHMTPWRLRRLGIVMEPDPTDIREAEGVLNPAVARATPMRLSAMP